LATAQASLSQVELELENKRRSVEALEIEVVTLKNQVKDHFAQMKSTLQNNSASNLAGSSFLQSLLEAPSINTIRSLKKETKHLKSKVNPHDLVYRNTPSWKNVNQTWIE
jgi:predicted  nucleic acid-binding Zn-ribbon protein